ncbi:hypothetical protein ILUMI_01470 [Ignelater luminosus]|uniref:Uncharacterized protein n=1 Tax=Ignelater luminosus TaxID=2038154 RepID=A0A8K0DIB1_IGNLU|nr:hypothetical protein ILUMI_01470 [Ignelater luminosus]
MANRKKTATAPDVLILPCDERLLDEQLSGSNIEITASESPISVESSEKLDHALSYSEEIEKAGMDNETIKNDEYTPNKADEDKAAIEDGEDDDYISLKTNASSDDNSSSTGNDEEAKIDNETSRVQKKKREKKAACASGLEKIYQDKEESWRRGILVKQE